MVKPKPIKPKVNPSFYLPNSFISAVEPRNYKKLLKLTQQRWQRIFLNGKVAKKHLENKHQSTSKTWTPFKNIKSPTRSLKVQFGPAKFGVRVATKFFSGHIKILKSVIVSIVMFQISRYQLRFPISLLTVRINA